jgi:hypothetical protein
MRKVICVLVGLVLAFCVGYGDAGESFAQSRFAFGIKPGMTIQNSYFGFTAGRFLPYASMDLLWMSVKMTETSEEHRQDDSYYGSTRYSYWDEQTIEGKALVLIPHFGSKLYIYGSQASEGLRSYLNGDLYFSISSVSGEEEESWRYTYDGATESGHSSDKWDKKTEELVEDVLSFWGFNLGFGTEYMFSEHFSIGGEYGFRLFFNKIKWQDENSWSYGTPGYDYHSYQEKWEDELSLTLRMNYAVVALNYYF